jgi:hypothetical protein
LQKREKEKKGKEKKRKEREMVASQSVMLKKY